MIGTEDPDVDENWWTIVILFHRKYLYESKNENYDNYRIKKFNLLDRHYCIKFSKPFVNTRVSEKFLTFDK